MKPSKILISIFVALVVSGCDQLAPAPTIDASSDESMKQSAQEIRESLPENERAEFDKALQVLAFSQINLNDIFAEGAAGAGNLEGKMRESLHGKTAREVVAEAERIQRERKAREKEQALNEIKELEQEKADAAAAREQLKAFEIIRSRFHMKEQRYSGKQPVIELTVKNGTSSAVSRAYFEGTIASPNRSVPWLKDTFNYRISGGLEPGEEASWSLAPNMFSDWGKVEAPADAIFTVTVERLDGADGEALYSTTGFSEREQKRLAELKQKYGLE